MSDENTQELDEKPNNRSWSLPRLGGAIWLLVVVLGMVGVGALLAMKVQVTGSVSADVLVRNVLFPLTIAVAGVFALGSYVAMKVVWGDKRTSSSLGKLVSVIKEAGAAEEMRKRRDE